MKIQNLYNFPSFQEVYQSNEVLACDPGGLKTIWFQTSGNLEHANVQVWRLIDNLQPFQYWYLPGGLEEFLAT